MAWLCCYILLLTSALAMQSDLQMSPNPTEDSNASSSSPLHVPVFFARPSPISSQTQRLQNYFTPIYSDAMVHLLYINNWCPKENHFQSQVCFLSAMIAWTFCRSRVRLSGSDWVPFLIEVFEKGSPIIILTSPLPVAIAISAKIDSRDWSSKSSGTEDSAASAWRSELAALPPFVPIITS